MEKAGYLNQAQSKGLADFLFDVAKGLILGGIGFAITNPPTVTIISSVFVALIAAACVRGALALLEEINI